MNGKVDVQKLMLYYYLSNLTLPVETPVYRQPCSIQCRITAYQLLCKIQFCPS